MAGHVKVGEVPLTWSKALFPFRKESRANSFQPAPKQRSGAKSSGPQLVKQDKVRNGKFNS